MKINSLTRGDVSRLLPPRSPRSNKGTYGRVLAVCGSVGMSGAAYFCAAAAYRSGCGLVEVLTVNENRQILQTQLPEAIVSAYNSLSPDNAAIAAAVGRADSIAIGCGLGQSDTAVEVLGTVLSAARVPITADADALNILSANPSLWELIRVPLIITPHPGEMSRLSGIAVGAVTSDIAGVAGAFAAKRELVCVLKDHNTVTSDGNMAYINTSGNSGMATGGSGDVLCGIIASIAAQRAHGTLTLTEAAALGVYLHGLAGDLAAEELGEYSIMASDIISHLPAAIKSSVR